MIRRVRDAGDFDLVITLLLAVAAVVAVVLALPTPVTFLLALPLVLALPGYALLAAVMPDNSLPLLERGLISAGASIALSILLGIALAVTPLGLGPLPWALGLAGLSAGLCAVAWFRRRRVPPFPTGTSTTIGLRPAATLAIAGLAAIAILAGTRAIAAEMEPLPPVQLWMMPAGPETTDALVGVRGGEPVGDYVVRLTSAGTLLHEFSITLAPGETWQQVVALGEQDRERPVVARLYYGDDFSEIRFVVLQPPPDEQ